MKDKTELKWLDKSTFELNATISQEKIEKEYQKALKELAQNVSLPGFRKGKAPWSQIEKKLGKEAIYQEVIKKAIPQVYQEAITEHHLKPIAEPKVSLVSAKEKKDWKVKIVSCILPHIGLGKYKEEIRKLSASAKIWTPGKETKEPAPEKKQKQEEERLSLVIKKLLEVVKTELPSFLIESEEQKRMVSLIDQLQKANLTIDQYLSTKNQTIEQLKGEIVKQIKSDWTLELVLEEIADQEKIQVSQEDLQKALAKGKKEPKVNPYLLARFLRRQKTLEFLLSL
ncbi:MAG: trigger factor [Candidatus Shapirobacteria bacterium]